MVHAHVRESEENKIKFKEEMFIKNALNTLNITNV